MDQVQVVAIDDAADGVRVLRLARPDRADLPGWEPGAHLELLLPGDVRRQYSLCGPRAARAEWTIGVLRSRPSRGGSAYMHEQVDVGEMITVTGVRNLFPLVSANEYIFVAGGIGITPLLPMVEAADTAGIPWRLHYGGRRKESMAFLERLAGYGDRVVVSPEDECGLLDLRATLAAARPGTLVYACGPEPLLVALQERSAEAELELHVERFAVAAPATSAESTSFEIELAQTGVTKEVPADQSIVDVLHETGIAILTSCREGVCGTCETKVLDGLPDHRDSILSEEERRNGETMMVCVSRSLSPRLLLDL
jgi:ferredoxin-NADP reductase